MSKFSVHLEVFFYARVDGTFRWDNDIIPTLRNRVEKYLMESKLFEFDKIRDEEEQFLVDQHWKLEYDLMTGAQTPLEVSDKTSELLKTIRLEAWELGLAESSVGYDITGKTH
jgi:hypothetical protein